MSYKFPLAFDSWDEKEKEAIDEVVQTGNFTMGKKVKKFEEEFSYVPYLALPLIQ